MSKFSVTSPEDIRKSQMNDSTAKFMYSFPKEARFTSTQKASENMNAFYRYPDDLSKSSTSFGYGLKYDFTKQAPPNPGPGRYPETDRVRNWGHRGISFGDSRDKVKFNALFKNKPKVPGPGAYETQEPTRCIKGYKIHKNSQSMKDHLIFPGPGYYDFLPTINAEAQYPQSKYRNAKVPRIHMSTVEPKLMEERHLVPPGPGAYRQNVIKEGNCQSILSTKNSQPTISIGKGGRDLTKITNTTPGPGMYRLPSDFGHYENSQIESSVISQTSNV